MSLINEALRKARKDAAERDAAERGVTYRPPRAHLPAARRSWLPALLGGVGLGVAVAAGVFFLLRPPTAGVAPTAEETAPAAAETPPPATDSPSIADDPAGVEIAEPTAATPTIPETVVPETSVPDSSPPETTLPETTRPETTLPETTLPETPAQESAPPEPEPSGPTEPGEDTRRVRPPERVGQVEERVYVLEATVDGVELRLDFVVWASNPFAQINGVQVSTGQTVEGFVVRSIAREEVTLEGESGIFRLRVR